MSCKIIFSIIQDGSYLYCVSLAGLSADGLQSYSYGWICHMLNQIQDYLSAIWVPSSASGTVRLVAVLLVVAL